MSKPPYKSNGPKRPGPPRNGNGASAGARGAGSRSGRGRDERASEGRDRDSRDRQAPSRGRSEDRRDAHRDERRLGRDERAARDRNSRDDARSAERPSRDEGRIGHRGPRRSERAAPADKAPARFGDRRRAREEQQRGAHRRGDERRGNRAESEAGSGASRGAPIRSASMGGVHTRNERPAFGERPHRDDRARPERPYSERPHPERPARARPSGERRSQERIPNEQGSSERPWAAHAATERGGSRTHGAERREGARPPRRDGDAPRRDSSAPRASAPLRGAGSAYAKPYRDSDKRPSVRPDLRTAPHKTSRPTGPTPKNPNLPEREGERIAKLLARAGVASRRDAERLIAEGRVKRGDEVIDAPSTVLLDLTGVTVDDQPVGAPEATRLFVFHKPAGLLTAERDPMGRPTIYTALRNALPEGTGRVIPVGRLDYNTEGLLLLTNDGEFKRQLELPSSAVPRTYRARAFGDITQPQLEALIEGIEIDGVHYGKIDANMERRTGRNQWIELTLTEGKNREVRRVLEHLGLEVSRLLRTAYGPFVLADLPKGLAYEVPPAALERFRNSLESGK
ncbi:pseudouridine synthase [Novosphingobium sp. 9]|uniref:pseudouridine synthase n=1 Tax=Novosphingobium sp. 9 TaxID=2025349 RepID=UPI0021B57096|nr:pseudouridine synthase [Novosphingobium sp. 9]